MTALAVAVAAAVWTSFLVYLLLPQRGSLCPCSRILSMSSLGLGLLMEQLYVLGTDSGFVVDFAVG